MTFIEKNFQVDPVTVHDKVILITGANSGLGLTAAKAICQANPKLLIITVRSREKGTYTLNLLKQINHRANVEYAILDLSSFERVRHFAREFLNRHELPLHVLINNAGVYNPPFSRNAHGIEITLATNHFGPFLLTHLLLPKLKASGTAQNPSRIIWVSSEIYPLGRIDLHDLVSSRMDESSTKQYADSKLMNIMTAVKMQRKLKSEKENRVLIFSCHPGLSDSELFNRALASGSAGVVAYALKAISVLYAQSLERGVISMLHCAFSPDILTEGGSFYGPLVTNWFNRFKRSLPKLAQDHFMLNALYDMSLRIVGLDEQQDSKTVMKLSEPSPSQAEHQQDEISRLSHPTGDPSIRLKSCL